MMKMPRMLVLMMAKEPSPSRFNLVAYMVGNLIA